jgi:pyridoxamine 5'-phosphate oxidase
MSPWHEETLPDHLPDSPMEIAAGWLRQAVEDRVQPNPEAMVLASTDALGRPSARVVLCRGFVGDPGYVVFYTNYQSRKGRELTERPEAAAVFHWDTMRRQMRIEGQVVRSPDHESDEYFASRTWQSRIGAWASRQSEPITSRPVLLDRVADTAAQFGGIPATNGRGQSVEKADVPRPPYWGGFRFWIARLELWVEGAGRVHDRAEWRRDLQRTDGQEFETGPWRVQRLQP